jgi:tetratricopeptide (TPR) repeat protein
VRAALHRSAALVLEKREGPAREEALAVLGDHWREAGEAARARPFYLAAARRALGVYAHAEAERLYRAFLALADADSPDTPIVRLELASKVLSIHGRSDEALDQCRTALEEAERLGDTAAQGAAYQQIGGLTFHAGRLSEAAGLFERALELHRQAGNRRAEGDALDNLASTVWLDGRLSEACVLFERALTIHREVQNRRSEGDTLNNLAGVSWQQGDLDRTPRSRRGGAPNPP